MYKTSSDNSKKDVKNPDSEYQIDLELVSLEASSTPKVSLSDIYLFGAIAKSTYEMKGQTEYILAQDGFYVNNIRDHDFLKSIISSNSAGDRIIAFRGTDNSANWIRDDARVRMEDIRIADKIVPVHRGFLHAVNLHWEDSDQDHKDGMKSEIMSKDDFKEVQYYITGHSLGGGMAFICSLKLLDLGIPAKNIHLYTYGQPRVFGDSIEAIITRSLTLLFTGKAWEPSYEIIDSLMKDIEYYRIVNEDDIIPRLPPESHHCLSFGYKHYGQLVYLDHGKVTYPEKQEDDIEISEWRDHLMDPYLNNIELALTGQNGQTSLY
ncbi:MAG: lipase family protein [Alphaproteobacteria bacterium]|nr:lipase family protein [Alphaproteobacteria bacterium]